MNPGIAFHAFGPAHLVVIVLTVALPFCLNAIARRSKSAAFDRAVRFALATLLIFNYAGYAIHQGWFGNLRWEQALPFQLCDWTMFAVIVALLSAGRRAWLEVSYFWGIGGSLQAIVTPNLQFGFPDIRFLSFFADHCAIVVGIAYLMLSRRFVPTINSVWRTLAWSEFYLAVTLLVDWVTGVNYGFLLHKPEAFSILSFLSDWRPLYILQLNGLAILFFAVLYAPFAIFDLLQAKRIRRAACEGKSN
jgi:hypothetical integral membrane protein (TIGR02206 family)